MNYDLAKKLKDAEFPLYKRQDLNGKRNYWFVPFEEPSKYETEKLFCPTLSELIEACGDIDLGLYRFYNSQNKLIWQADDDSLDMKDGENKLYAVGSTPEEAVANLYLALNKK